MNIQRSSYGHLRLIRVLSMSLILMAGVNASFGQSPKKLEEFGQMILLGLAKGDFSVWRGLVFTEKAMRETVSEKTKDQEVAENILKEIKEGFDAKMMGEARDSFERLSKSTVVTDWKKVKFVKVEFEKHEERTSSSGITFGSGRLTFNYGGRDFFMEVRRMAETVAGWQCNEISTEIELVYKNQ